MPDPEIDKFLSQIQHQVRLGFDAFILLGRCLDECDMDPDLTIDVTTLLLRAKAHTERMAE